MEKSSKSSTFRNVQHIALLELNLLNYSKAVALDGATLGAATPVYDVNGEELFHRFALLRRGTPHGYADVAVHPAMGSPLLAVAPDAVWNEQAIVALAREALLRGAVDEVSAHYGKSDYDDIRIVAYSFPKVAVQFLRGGKEVEMLECFTWTPVPPAQKRRDRKRLEPGNFERWSLINEMDARRKEENRRKFQQRTRQATAVPLDFAGDSVISQGSVEPLIVVGGLTQTAELHYSRRPGDHHVCYELRGQETNVWCVGASVQMMLDFYRYNYSQTKIAVQLGLGTPTNPNGLPYARVGDVVTQLQVMSNNALTAQLIVNPSFNDFVTEINQNRPMISFIPGHSRTVAGYTQSRLSIHSVGGFRGLLVYDPWPPNAGVITRWENFDTQTYNYAYSAHVTTI
jgi:peptidase C39-like protein